MNFSSVQSLLTSLARKPISKEYYSDYSRLLCVLCRAEHCLLLQLQGEEFQIIPTAEPSSPEWLQQKAAELARSHGEKFRQQAGAVRQQGTDDKGQMRIVAALQLSPDPLVLAILDLPFREKAHVNELLLRAQLVTCLVQPAQASEVFNSLPLQSPGDRAQPNAMAVLDGLEIVAEVLAQKHFEAAVGMLVNALAAELGCVLTALAWDERGYARIVGLSHVSRFDHKTEQTRLLESACEEALNQQQLLIYPSPDDEGILLAHRQLQQALGVSRILSLPLYHPNGELLAVLLLAEDQVQLDPDQLNALMVCLGVLLPWLDERRRQDRWWGPRLVEWGGKKLENLLGPDRLWQKVAGLVVCGALLYICLASWSFRLEAVGQMVTDQTRVFGAPYDGYIDQASVTTGDEVRKGMLLASLDVKDLFLQESEIRAEIQRIRADEDKARAANSLIDVEIAQARLAQSRARLQRVLYQRDQAAIRAPYDGVIVEGERKDLLGEPVRKGDPLFRLARVEGLYGRLELPEHLIRFLTPQATGELALLAQPDQRIAFRVEEIVPMAQVKGQKGNYFVLKVRFGQKAESWWRPGMSGVARIDAGQRSPLWLGTYRLIDTLRMRLWW